MKGKIGLFAFLFVALTVLVVNCGGGGGGSTPSNNTSTFTISGTITSSGTGTSGVTVSLSGASTDTATTDASGSYSFTGLANGSYTVTPSKTDLTFSPPSSAQTVNSANISEVNFTGAASIAPTYSISGTVASVGSGTALQGVTVTLTSTITATATATTDASGNYTFTGIANGTYKITPSLNLYTFTPANRLVTINGANSTTNNFTSTILTAGLVAYYPFSGNANDASGNGNNGTVSGATLTTDRFGNANRAYYFDGTSSYINCGNSTTFDLNNHTIVAWINIDSIVDPAGKHIVGKVNSNTYETLSFGIKDSNNTIGTAFATGTEINHSLSSTTALQPNHWYYVAMTYDNSTVEFYIDGVLDSSFSRTGTVRTCTNNLAIGRHNGDVSVTGPALFKGSIDDVRIYNRALSASEMQALYTSTQ
jgi:hypothetical protein